MAGVSCPGQCIAAGVPVHMEMNVSGQETGLLGNALQLPVDRVHSERPFAHGLKYEAAVRLPL
jgi:hypothetical protein